MDRAAALLFLFAGRCPLMNSFCHWHYFLFGRRHHPILKACRVPAPEDRALLLGQLRSREYPFAVRAVLRKARRIVDEIDQEVREAR